MTPLLLFAPFLVALCLPLISRLFKGFMPFVVSLLPLSILLGFLAQLYFPSLAFFENTSWQWFEPLAVGVDLRFDGIALIFGVMISLIGTLLFYYARAYFGDNPREDRFYSFLLVFFAAMIFVAICDNIFGFFIFWELTSVSSFLLIGYNHEGKQSRDSALQALLVTGAGGLSLLAGFMLLFLAATDLGLSPQQAARFSSLSGIDLESHSYYPVIVLLVLIGAFTKSAQVPFHFWLPAAMSAPTPVSSFLHSATMVKAGIILVARLSPVLGAGVLWESTLLVVGLATMFWSALSSVLYRDLKQILAYSTVSVLAGLFVLLGIGSVKSIEAFGVFLLAHAFYKASLFQVVGIIDKKTGSRDIVILGGLGRKMPFTALTALLSGLSMMGIPLFLGFYSKELFYLSVLKVNFWILIPVVLSFVLSSVAALRVFWGPFWSAEKSSPMKPSDPSFLFLFSPLSLALAGIVFSIFVVPIQDLMAGLNAYLAEGGDSQLKLWHGFKGDYAVALILSLVTLVLSVSFYILSRNWVVGTQHFVESMRVVSGKYIFSRLLEWTYDLARITSQTIQHGYLRKYIRSVFLFLILLLAFPLFQSFRQSWLPITDISTDAIDWIMAIMIISGLGFVMMTDKRLSALAGMGLIGFGVVVLFSNFSAPDLAITLVLTEVLTVILFVLVFYHLPRLGRYSTRSTKLKDLAFASLVGLSMSVLVLAANSFQLDTLLRDYYAEKSLSVAFGRNVVNVILVDFRALDTLGEVIVVTIAGFGVFSLLAKKTKLRAKSSRKST